MGCPPVLGDNPRALASGLSYVQVDNLISPHLAHHEIFRAKVGKGGIMSIMRFLVPNLICCLTHISSAKRSNFCN